jgi:hypothetical protein
MRTEINYNLLSCFEAISIHIKLIIDFMSTYNRRNFIKMSALAGTGLSIYGNISSLYGKSALITGKRVGIIGLDTSHSVAFTKTLNATDAAAVYKGYKIVAAYPKGSNDIITSVERIPGIY